MRRIYLDHATTTPIAPEVRGAMEPYLSEEFGAPAAPHRRGAAAREAIEAARGEVAALLRAPAEEIVFTGSATEANNLALKGLALAPGQTRRTILAAATEHISVLHPLKTLERHGCRVVLLPTDGHGAVDPDRLRDALTRDTILVSIAHASAEIGTLQPLLDLCRVARAEGVPLHTDATLTAGALALPAPEDLPDLVTLCPHMFYGPKGIGALRVRRGLRLAPLIEGGAQEGGLRAGTEAVAAIVGFGAAARLAGRDRARRAATASRLERELRRLIFERLDALTLTGHPEARLPGHLSLCAKGVEAEAVLGELDARGIEAASGSPCTTEVRKASDALLAIGLDPVLARGALTFSFGEENQPGDPEEVASALAGIVTRLRGLSPLP